jgi:hypothetical protein
LQFCCSVSSARNLHSWLSLLSYARIDDTAPLKQTGPR